MTSTYGYGLGGGVVIHAEAHAYSAALLASVGACHQKNERATARFICLFVSTAGLRCAARLASQAAMAYNRSDGTTYVIVRDDSSPSRPEGATASTAAAAAPLARPQRTYASLNALFTAAASPRFTYADWLAASTSGSDATAWRVLIKWPFGEEGGVFRFNKAGDALYIASSLDRSAPRLLL